MFSVFCIALFATASSATSSLLAQCKDDVFFLQNLDLCVNLLLDDKALPSSDDVNVTDEVSTESSIDGLVAAVDDDQDNEEAVLEIGSAGVVKDRAADLSGCGVHRVCMECAKFLGCFWNPGTGCIARFNNAPTVCTIENNIAPTCPAFSDCKSCTTQNGCVFFRGACTYSKGTGCQEDPANCINYSWMCPAATPTLVVTPQQVQVRPVYGGNDRVLRAVAQLSDMILGMSAAEIARLRVELNALLVQKEQQAVFPATMFPASPYMPYSPSLYQKPSPWRSTNSWDSQPFTPWANPQVEYTPSTNSWDSQPSTPWANPQVEYTPSTNSWDRIVPTSTPWTAQTWASPLVDNTQQNAPTSTWSFETPAWGSQSVVETTQTQYNARPTYFGNRFP